MIQSYVLHSEKSSMHVMACLHFLEQASQRPCHVIYKKRNQICLWEFREFTQGKWLPSQKKRTFPRSTHDPCNYDTSMMHLMGRLVYRISILLHLILITEIGSHHRRHRCISWPVFTLWSKPVHVLAILYSEEKKGEKINVRVRGTYAKKLIAISNVTNVSTAHSWSSQLWLINDALHLLS